MGTSPAGFLYGGRLQALGRSAERLGLMKGWRKTGTTVAESYTVVSGISSPRRTR